MSKTCRDCGSRLAETSVYCAECLKKRTDYAFEHGNFAEKLLAAMEEEKVSDVLSMDAVKFLLEPGKRERVVLLPTQAREILATIQRLTTPPDQFVQPHDMVAPVTAEAEVVEAAEALHDLFAATVSDGDESDDRLEMLDAKTTALGDALAAWREGDGGSE